MRKPVLLAALVVATAAAIAGPSAENPLIPSYPFRSAKITYKKTATREAEAIVTGAKVWFKEIKKQGPTSKEEICFTDGRWLFEVESRGDRREAKKKLHTGTWLVADYAGLEAGARAKFDGGLEALWNVYSPVFGIDWLDMKNPAVVGAIERVCGRDCQSYKVTTPMGVIEYWRWVGTDIPLRIKAMGETLEAEKIEENVAVDASLFAEPPGTSKELARKIDADAAKRIFKDLCGLEARGELIPDAPPSAIKIDGHDVSLHCTFFFFRGKDAKHPSTLKVTGHEGGWRFELAAHGEAKLVGELAGKTIPLKERDLKLEGKGVKYRCTEGAADVISANEGAVVLSIAGKWKRIESSEDEGERETGVEVTPFRITASSE